MNGSAAGARAGASTFARFLSLLPALLLAEAALWAWSLAAGWPAGRYGAADAARIAGAAGWSGSIAFARAL
ncbi:MAG: hypothetical protein ACTHKZ_08325, partial [Lysobacteraceae bacterium]